jgi:hypothetical protein
MNHSRNRRLTPRTPHTESYDIVAVKRGGCRETNFKRKYIMIKRGRDEEKEGIFREMGVG